MQRKMMVGVVVVLALGIGGWYWYTQTEDYQSEKLLRDWETAYRNDTYGGATPEETLALFVDALKEGNTDLASKYFLVEDQKKQLDYLDSLKDRDEISKMISDLNKARWTKEAGVAYLTLVDSSNTEISQMVFKLITVTSKWKIIEL